MFHHPELVATSPRSKSVTNPRNELKRISSKQQEKQTQGNTRICYRSSTSHLEVYVSIKEPTKCGLMHQATFPLSSDHKDRAS
jgi:hypothetical protein